MTRWFWISVFVSGFWLVAAAASAQPLSRRANLATVSGATALSETTLTELLERIDALQQRVDALEQRLARAAPVADAPASVIATARARTVAPHGSHEPTEAQMAQPIAAETQYPSLRLHGFADVNFVATDDSTPAGFHMGQLVLHFASALGPKVNVFVETSFTPRAPGGAVPTSYTPDVERALIRYDHNDAFKLSFGRFHTPIGYWNTAYHHGLFLQTTVSRPAMIDFGTVFQPVHFVGMLAEGRLPVNRLGLGYSAGIGNGRASLIARAGDAGDSNSHKAMLATLTSRPEGARSLELGVSVYRDRLTPAGVDPVNEWITGAHVAWTNETPEVIAEFTNVRHTLTTTGKTYNRPAYYVQAAYRMPWDQARWKPYYRFENTDTPPDEFLFTTLDMSTSTLGVRFDVADFATFKGEYRRVRRVATPRVNALFLQTSFTF